MRNKFEEFKAQLAAWCDLEGWESIDRVWRERSDWHELPEWVHAVLWVEGHDLFHALNGYWDDDCETENTFTKLLEKCGVWWEMENSCVVWIYDVDVLDEFVKKENGVGLFQSSDIAREPDPRA